jgi:hypothetical protein
VAGIFNFGDLVVIARIRQDDQLSPNRLGTFAPFKDQGAKNRPELSRKNQNGLMKPGWKRVPRSSLHYYVVASLLRRGLTLQV